MAGVAASAEPGAAADDRLFTAPYLWILVTNFFAIFNLNLFILLPSFVRGVGGSEATIGLVMGTPSLAAFLVRFWLGGLLDRYGRRQFILMGVALSVVSSMGYLFVETAGPLLFICRATHGVAFAMYFTAMITLTADTVPPSRRTQALAWTGVAGFTANALSPAIGEWVLAAGGGVSDNLFGAYRTLFLFALGIAVLAWVLGTRTHRAHHEGSSNPEGVLRLFRRREMRIVFLPTVAMGIGFGTAFMFIKDFAQTRGVENVGPFFVTYSVVVIVLRVTAGRRLDMMNRNAIIFPSLALLVLGVFLQQWLREPWWLIVVGLCCGGGHGLLYPTLSAMAYEAVPPAQRGAAMAIYTMGFDVGLFIGTWSLGFVARSFGYPTMYTCGALITLAGLLWYISLAPKGGNFHSAGA